MKLWRTCRLFLKQFLDRLSVFLRNRHTSTPLRIGNGHHDCALSSLYWAMPALSESDIVEAFNACCYTWPHGGVTNKEFAIALKYLGVDSHYSKSIDTLGQLLSRNPSMCVALLHRHFIAIVDGAIVGQDANRDLPPDARVYCHWTFSRQSSRRAQSSRRTPFGNA